MQMCVRNKGLCVRNKGLCVRCVSGCVSGTFGKEFSIHAALRGVCQVCQVVLS